MNGHGRHPLVLALALAVPAAGCATIARGTHQSVTIRCQYNDARVTLDGVPIGTGIVNTELSRDEDHLVVAEMQGCKQYRKTIKSSTSEGGCVLYTLVVYVGCCFIIGLPLLIPYLVDAIDGSLDDLDPSDLSVYLHAEDEPAPQPPTPRRGARTAEEEFPAPLSPPPSTTGPSVPAPAAQPRPSPAEPPPQRPPSREF